MKEYYLIFASKSLSNGTISVSSMLDGSKSYSSLDAAKSALRDHLVWKSAAFGDWFKNSAHVHYADKEAQIDRLMKDSELTNDEINIGMSLKLFPELGISFKEEYTIKRFDK